MVKTCLGFYEHQNIKTNNQTCLGLLVVVTKNKLWTYSLSIQNVDDTHIHHIQNDFENLFFAFRTHLNFRNNPGAAGQSHPCNVEIKLTNCSVNEGKVKKDHLFSNLSIVYDVVYSFFLRTRKRAINRTNQPTNQQTNEHIQTNKPSHTLSIVTSGLRMFFKGCYFHTFTRHGKHHVKAPTLRPKTNMPVEPLSCFEEPSLPGVHVIVWMVMLTTSLMNSILGSLNYQSWRDNNANLGGITM